MTTINWNIEPKDAETISKIVDSACNELDIEDRMSLAMDITATHLNGTLLDLEKLQGFDKFNFAHDIYGIMGYIDRNDGQIKRGFLPRCSK